MEELTNIGESIGDLGAIAENLNPAEEIGGQIEEVTGGLSDSIGQAAEQVEGGIGDIFGGL